MKSPTQDKMIKCFTFKDMTQNYDYGKKHGISEGRKQCLEEVKKIIDKQMNPKKLKHNCGGCDYCILKAKLEKLGGKKCGRKLK